MNRFSYSAITVAAVVIAVYVSYAFIGEMVVIPILDYFIEARRASGESVGVFEAIAVFVLVMTYMVVITSLVVTASLTGWFVSRVRSVDEFSWQTMIEIFQVKEPE